MWHRCHAVKPRGHLPFNLTSSPIRSGNGNEWADCLVTVNRLGYRPCGNDPGTFGPPQGLITSLAEPQSPRLQPARLQPAQLQPARLQPAGSPAAPPSKGT